MYTDLSGCMQMTEEIDGKGKRNATSQRRRVTDRVY